MDSLFQSKKFKIALVIVVIILLGAVLAFSGIVSNNSEPVSEVEKHREELDELSLKEDKGEQVILMPKAEVYSFVMTDSKGIVIKFEKTDAGWVYLDDKDFNLNQDRIDKILNYLCDVRAIEFIENTDGEKYGLNQDSKSYTLVDGSDDSIIISIGNKDEESGKVYFAINYDFSTVYVNSGKLDKVSEYGIMDLVQR